MGDVNGVKVCSAQLAVAGRCGGGGDIWRTSVLQPSPASSGSRSPGISSWVSPSLPLAQVTRTSHIFTQPLYFYQLRRILLLLILFHEYLCKTESSGSNNRQFQVGIVIIFIINKLNASFKLSSICQQVLMYLKNKQWGIHYLFFMYQKDKTITQVASAKEKHQGCFASKGHLLNFFSFSKRICSNHMKS